MCAVLHAWHGADVYLAADPTTLLAARTGGKPKPSVCFFIPKNFILKECLQGFHCVKMFTAVPYCHAVIGRNEPLREKTKARYLLGQNTTCKY